MKRNRNIYDSVAESNKKDYIGFNSLHKVTQQKNSLHYSSRDVTNLPALPTSRLSNSASSAILETDLDDFFSNCEHIYESLD